MVHMSHALVCVIKLQILFHTVQIKWNFALVTAEYKAKHFQEIRRFFSEEVESECGLIGGGEMVEDWSEDTV